MTDAANMLEALGEELLNNDSSEIVSTSGRQGATSTTEEKALELLGKGIANEIVASAIGVTPARITQLLADEEFAAKVQKARYINLQKHTLRDNMYDDIEEKLLKKLQKSLGLIIKPDTLLKAITVINSAKRRGNSNSSSITDTTDIAEITIPQVIKQTFVTNINNQVVQVGDRDLTTISPEGLQIELEATKNAITSREDNTGGES